MQSFKPFQAWLEEKDSSTVVGTSDRNPLDIYFSIVNGRITQVKERTTIIWGDPPTFLLTSYWMRKFLKELPVHQYVMDAGTCIMMLNKLFESGTINAIPKTVWRQPSSQTLSLYDPSPDDEIVSPAADLDAIDKSIPMLFGIRIPHIHKPAKVPDDLTSVPAQTTRSHQLEVTQ